VITPSDVQQHIATNELSFVPQEALSAPPAPVPNVNNSPARRPTFFTPRILIAIILLLCLIGGGIWFLRSTTLNWQPNTSQRISITLTVDIAADANIDIAFANAYSDYIRTTYGTNMQITSTPHFLGRPPEAIRQNADGTTHYQGIIVADIAPKSPQP
jgi:hypothetical protein